MGRTKELDDDTEGMSLNIFKDQKKELKKIALRDYDGNMAELGREMAKEFIKNHGDGNPIYVLEKWTENKDFQAVPATMSNKEKWREHYKNSDDKSKAELRSKINEIAETFDNVEFNDTANKKFGRMRRIKN